MSANHDKSFVITFLGVLGALVAFTLVISVIAGFLTAGDDKATTLSEPAARKLEARLAPVGQVITDPAALMKAAAPAAAHAPLSGEQVVTQVCGACHGAGVLGAPKIGDKAAWGARKSAAGGVDGLAASAIKGKNAMPARGGNPDLSDAEIKGAIEQMLKQTGV